MADSQQDVSTDGLELLLELQEIDSRIRRIQHQLDHLEEQQALDEVEKEASKIKEDRAEQQLQLERAEAQQRKLDGEIDLLRQRKDAEHARMYSGDISNPKELQSLRAEIESTERRISEHEDQLLKVMEVAEELESRISDLDERGSDVEQQKSDLADARDDAAKDLIAEKAELEVERDRHREQLSDDLLSRYDRAVEQHAGVGVARLQGGMCTGCRIELPTVDQQELIEGPPLGRCPQCGRLLVID